MIAAVVAELELIGPSAECEADELMSEADAEYRSLAHETPDVVTSVIDRLWIAGAVRQKDSVGTESQDIFCGGLGGNDGNVAALVHQHAQDVLLDAVIVGDHVQLLSRIGLGF